MTGINNFLMYRLYNVIFIDRTWDFITKSCGLSFDFNGLDISYYMIEGVDEL